MKIKFEKPYFKRYRQTNKIHEELHNSIHHDDFYSLWFNVLPAIEVMFFSYGKDHRYNSIDLTFEWLFWGIVMKVNFDKERKDYESK